MKADWAPSMTCVITGFTFRCEFCKFRHLWTVINSESIGHCWFANGSEWFNAKLPFDECGSIHVFQECVITTSPVYIFVLALSYNRLPNMNSVEYVQLVVVGNLLIVVCIYKYWVNARVTSPVPVHGSGYKHSHILIFSCWSQSAIVRSAPRFVEHFWKSPDISR